MTHQLRAMSAPALGKGGKSVGRAIRRSLSRRNFTTSPDAEGGAASTEPVYNGAMIRPSCDRRSRTSRLGLLRLHALALTIVALLLPCVGASPAHAQADPFAWFTHLFQPAPPPSRVIKPRPEFHRAAPRRASERTRPSGRRDERPADSATAKPAAPAVAPTYFVAVLGDSLGQMLEQGLTEAFADRPEVAILRKAKENSGLVRDDFYDWTKAAQDLLASGEKINFAVMMIGSNDRQTLRDGKGGAFEPRSPQWVEAYAHRIETIASMFRDKKIPLVWVGLPVLKSERLSADASAFNDLYREYASKAGATYVDVWEAFANDAGEYSAMGPDLNGQIVKLRAADGIHFTKAGARKLAHFVEPDIRRNLDETAPPNPESPAISAPAEASLPPADASPNGAPGASSSEPAGAPAPPPPPKPIAGPVLPLTGPVRAPGGELASRAASPQAPARQTLRQEQQTDPKPGRADDFSWPRP